MNPLQRIERAVRKDFPRVETRIDLPTKTSGTAYLDIRLADFIAVMEWRKGSGFGISAPPGDAYGSGSDEVFASEKEALARLLDLIRRKAPTHPSREISLKRLREIRRLTQEELAKRLDVKQATIAKLEQRDEVRVGTLRRVVEGMGGKLEVVARFPDGAIPLDFGGER